MPIPTTDTFATSESRHETSEVDVAAFPHALERPFGIVHLIDRGRKT